MTALLTVSGLSKSFEKRGLFRKKGGTTTYAVDDVSFTLERGGKYVVCEVRPAGGMRGAAETTSTG